MSIPSGFSRNVISGKLPGGEIWQCSLWANEAPSDQNATAAQATAWAGKVSTDLAATGSPLNFMAAGATVDTLTTYSYLDSTGKATYVGTAAITGGTASGSQGLPDQCSLAVTLLTGHAGRRNRGRIFMPCHAGTITNGQLTSASVSAIATWWSNLITHLNSTIGAQHICVLSQAGASSYTVNAVQVDSKIDIQRRRADKLQPTYKSVVVVT